MATNNNSHKDKKSPSGWVKTLIIAILTALTAFVAGTGVFIHEVAHADIPDSIDAVPGKHPVTITHNDGSVMATVMPPDGVRKVIDSSDIPQHMKDAITSAEDKTFYDNFGFNPVRIASAGYGYITGNHDRGGGSTISQQLIKNITNNDEYTLKRKYDEIMSATKMTATWSKDDILTAYLNTVYMGRGAFGVQQAAQAYFGVNAAELNLPQSILLAGVVQSPSQLDPHVNKEASENRFNYVVEQMVENGHIEPQEAQGLSLPEVTDYVPESSQGIEGPNGHIVEMVFKELEEEGVGKDTLFTQGATIKTTIDPEVNRVVQEQGDSTSNEMTKNALVATDPETGGILGLFGGKDGMGLNYAEAPQQTGSTFKVFTLLAALENGITLDQKLDSSPYDLNGTTIHNSEDMSCGVCSLAEATKQSLNTSFYRLQDMLPEGPRSTQKMAHQMGITDDLAESDGSVNHSIALGTYTSKMTDMSSAMATIAGGGVKHTEHVVDSVQTLNGGLSYKFQDTPVRVLSENTSEQTKKALEPIPAYSNGNQLDGKTGYAKTGTVQFGDTTGVGNRDALVMGFTDDVALSVWYGTDGGEPLYEQSGGQMWGAGQPMRTWKIILDQVG